MALFGPRNFILKNKHDIVIRHCTATDAEYLPEFLASIALETHHTLQYPGKKVLVDATKDRWHKAEQEPGFVFLGAFSGSRIIGQCVFYRESDDHPWIRDNAKFAMFVLKEFWGSGVATELMLSMNETLSSWNIKRLEATVRCENERGLTFYKKFGFEVEGIRKNCARILDTVQSEFYIVRLF